MANQTECIFCKIAAGEIPSSKVYEDENLLAFHDIQPAAPVHLLIIPKKHIDSLNEIEPQDKELMGSMLLTAQSIARTLGISESGYRIVNNCGPDGGQVVYHLHVHLLGGEKIGPLNAKN